jgi:hypothetical protein
VYVVPVEAQGTIVNVSRWGWIISVMAQCQGKQTFIQVILQLMSCVLVHSWVSQKLQPLPPGQRHD